MATTFEYMSDWVSHFEGILNNELRDELENRNLIKGCIVESNQSFSKFIKTIKNAKFISSNEKAFHTLVVHSNGKEYSFYIDTLNPRFWIIHSIAPQDDMDKLIREIFTRKLLQDNLYLSREKMESYHEGLDVSSAGFSLNFEQLFNSEEKSAFQESLDGMTTTGFTLKLWEKGAQNAKAQLEALRKAKWPINYKSSNFVFKEEGQVLVKEDLSFDGSFTLNRGKNFRTHLKFIDRIKEDYAQTMKKVESNILDWKNLSGGLFYFEFKRKINPKIFSELLFKTEAKKEFRIAGFKMYEMKDALVFNCVDMHTASRFYLEIRSDYISVNLIKGACGNVIFKLLSNLQRFFISEIEFYLNDELFNL